jgi:hypothetical protein
LTQGDEFVDSNGNAVRYGANFVAIDVAAVGENLKSSIEDADAGTAFEPWYLAAALDFALEGVGSDREF